MKTFAGFPPQTSRREVPLDHADMDQSNVFGILARPAPGMHLAPRGELAEVFRPALRPRPAPVGPERIAGIKAAA